MEERSRWAAACVAGDRGGVGDGLHEAGDAHVPSRLLSDGIDPGSSLMHVIFLCESLALGPAAYRSLKKLGFCVAGGLWDVLVDRASVAASGRDAPGNSICCGCTMPRD